MRRRTEVGFTLIEAAIAIAVVAILAGAMAPLALKAINQQREIKTRERLNAAFEAMFGARDRRVANMRSDFGFSPSSNQSSIPILSAKAGTAWSTVPAYAYNSGAYFPWGYNGPYWSGPTNSSGAPLDGWGRPIQMRYINGGWQAFSVGPNGVDDTTTSFTPLGDDLAYPVIAAPPLSHSSALNVVITSPGSNNISGSCTLSYLQGTSSLGTSSQTIYNSYNQSLGWAGIPSGGMQLTFTPSASGFSQYTLALDLLPGETRQVDITF